jgi:transposase
LLPKKEEERQQWAERVGRDGFFLLEQVYLVNHHAELSELPSVEILRQVWIQNFYEVDGQVVLRQQKEQPPDGRQVVRAEPIAIDRQLRTICSRQCGEAIRGPVCGGVVIEGRR